MTHIDREDILRMAQEAGIEFTFDPTEQPMRCFVEAWEDDLDRFFQAAYAAGAAAATEEANRRANASWTHMCEKMVAAEREACAKVCEQWDASHPQRIAAAIRARGQA